MRHPSLLRWTVSIAALLSACGPEQRPTPGAADASVDTTIADTLSGDTVIVDAASLDTTTDIATGDATTNDIVDAATSADRGPDDAGLDVPTTPLDVVAIDQPPVDLGPLDAGNDTGPLDSGNDVGPPDVGPPDTGPTCTPPTTLCGSACVNQQTSVMHCGRCDNSCPAPTTPNSRAACVQGQCSQVCSDGYHGQPGNCLPIAAPRPIAPLSGFWISSRRPTFRWVNPSGNVGATLDVCSDRACTLVLGTFSLDGESGQPDMELPANRAIFWRLRGQRDGRTGLATQASAVWLLHTPIRTTTAAISTCGFHSRDINADGYADLAIPQASVGGAVIDYGGTGLIGDERARQSITTSISNLGDRLARGDFDGDGFGDVVLGSYDADGSRGRLAIYRGRGDGLIVDQSQEMSDPSPIEGGTFGFDLEACDVNADGYDDLLVGRPGFPSSASFPRGFYVFYGAPTGLSSTRNSTHFLTSSYPGSFVRCVGDVNADGFPDVLSRGIGGVNSALYFGSATGLASAPSRSLAPATPTESIGLGISRLGDLNADGYADFVIPAWPTNSFGFDWYLGASGGPSTTQQQRILTSGDGNLQGANYVSGGTFDGGQTWSILVSRSRVGDGTSLEYRSQGGSFTGVTPVIRASPGPSEFGFAFDVGDLNGDGYCDLAITSNGVTPSGNTPVHLYRGGSAGLPSTPTQSLTTPRPSVFRL